MLIGLAREKIFYPKSRITNMENFASDPRADMRKPKMSVLPEEMDDDIVDA